MVSLDNFNERQKYKAVWHGDGSRGFDGATCMIIQPGPKSIKIPADQRTNLFNLIKHTNIDFSLACIDTKLELHLSLFLSGNSDLSLSDVNGDQGQQTFSTKAMEEINRLFIYYIDRLKPHIKHLSLSVLDDPLSYQDKLDDIICISLLTGYNILVFSYDPTGLLVCDLCVRPCPSLYQQGALFTLAVDGKFQPLIPISNCILFSGDPQTLKNKFETNITSDSLSKYLQVTLNQTTLDLVVYKPLASDLQDCLQFYKDNSQVIHSQIQHDDKQLVNSALSVTSINRKEQDSVNVLTSDMFLYFMLKTGAEDKCYSLPDMKTFCRNFRSETGLVEKSDIIYMDLTTENPDGKNAVKSLLDKVHKDLQIGIKLKYVIVEGDGLLFHHYYKLKEENPTYYSWLLPYPGDWHILKNYTSCLFKIYGPAGLKELVTKFHKGSTAASVLEGRDFDKTLSFLLQVYESIYRFQIHTFLEHRNLNTELTCSLDNDTIFQYLKQSAILVESASSKDFFVTQIHNLNQQIKGTDTEFKVFSDTMSNRYPTWRFWTQFLTDDCFAYIALYISIRSRNWNLRLAALKLMAPLFHCTNSTFYYRLIPQHLAALHSFPASVIQNFKQGGFVVSLLGHDWSLVGIDECHEMTINKELKSVITTLNMDNIKNKMHFLKYQTDIIQNIKSQYTCTPDLKIKSLKQGKAYMEQRENNIQVYMKMLQTSSLITDQLDNESLKHLITKEEANSLQKLSLLNFRQNGQKSLINYIETCICKSTHSFNKSKFKIINFDSSRKSTNKSKQLTDAKQVEKIIRKQIEWSKLHNIPLKDLTQFIKYPLAISSPDGSPNPGQKSAVSHLYRSLAPDAFTSFINQECGPDTVVIDAMFILNVPPSSASTTFGEYVTSLYKQWVSYYFSKYRSVSQVDLAFDKQSEAGLTPKQFERRRRDSIGSPNDSFFTINKDTKLPGKWNDFMSVRGNKKLLVHFVCDSFCELGQFHLQPGQSLILSGGFSQEGMTVLVQHNQSSPVSSLQHNHEEGDSLVWFLATQSSGSNILIYSPDNDTFNIGLPLASQYSKQFTVQLKSSNYDKQYLLLNKLTSILQHHSSFHTISPLELFNTLQSLFICTGCDYISYFKNHGKKMFYKTFIDNTEFIQGRLDGTGGKLCDTSESNRNKGFLAFIRLVGCEYFSKYSTSFLQQAPDGRPQSLFIHLFNSQRSMLENHSIWLSEIRNSVMFRSPSEEYYIPSDDALRMHWYRSCWVSQVWHQANNNTIQFPDLTSHGWLIENESLLVKWDSELNFKKTDNFVKLWTKGCGCKKDLCKSKRCGCSSQEKPCGPGCLCNGLCFNAPEDPQAALQASSSSSEPVDDTDIVHDTMGDLTDEEPDSDQEVEDMD